MSGTCIRFVHGAMSTLLARWQMREKINMAAIYFQWKEHTQWQCKRAQQSLKKLIRFERNEIALVCACVKMSGKCGKSKRRSRMAYEWQNYRAVKRSVSAEICAVAHLSPGVLHRSHEIAIWMCVWCANKMKIRHTHTHPKMKYTRKCKHKLTQCHAADKIWTVARTFKERKESSEKEYNTMCAW